MAMAGICIAVIALAPLVPWTIRNFRTLHHFQPLAPRYANEPEELTPRGFNAWVKTWMAEYASVEEIYWNVQGDKIDAKKLPSRALDEPGRDETLALIADYNQTQELTARSGRALCGAGGGEDSSASSALLRRIAGPAGCGHVAASAHRAFACRSALVGVQ